MPISTREVRHEIPPRGRDRRPHRCRRCRRGRLLVGRVRTHRRRRRRLELHTGYGNTIDLDAAPQRIVVDAYSAAALWDYGIRPAGIFGYGITGGQATGNADVSTMKVVGTDGEMNMEALADLDRIS